MVDQLSASAATATAGGLSEAEAQRRIAARGEVQPPATSRSYASIVRANTFTVFNLILAVFGILTLTFGDWRDALFLGVLVGNTSVGIAQEVRAKRALDRLAALVAPVATVVRDGTARDVPVVDVVDGDLIRIKAGDQIVADGTVVDAQELSIDASILTGESEAVPAEVGSIVHSGSFAAEGAGAYRAEATGGESYAEQLAGRAREFDYKRSPLERAVNRLLLALVGLVVVLGAILGYSLWRHQPSIGDAVATATAAVLSLVPEGLVLLVSVTYAIAALRMARKGALAQQLNAIESLASIDVICTDKTGTLTEPSLRIVELVPAAGVDKEHFTELLGRYAASTPEHNNTLAAIAAALPGAAAPVTSRVPFSSRRRWSALELAGESLVFGAPERFELGALAAEAGRHGQSGRRVLALARGPVPLTAGPGDDAPPGLTVLGLVVLGEELRPETRSMIEYLLREGVEVKVLSGDAPATVAAIAHDAGIPLDGGVRAGADLPADPKELREVALATAVVGRVSPDDKRRFVEALSAAGKRVAMVGDGVNDVPALKAAQLAIAQGSGAQMARSVSALVLVGDSFAVIPPLIEQGRQALRNLQRVAKLYVTKSTFAAFLILMIGTTTTAYPLLPRHFSLGAALTIGIPTFFLALAPSRGEWRADHFTRDVARFAVPAGFLTGTGVIASYLFALQAAAMPLIEARTVALTVLVAVGLYLILVLEASGLRRRTLVSVAVAVLAGAYVVALLTAPVRDFFQLATPTVGMILVAAFGTALSIYALAMTGFTPALANALHDDGEPAAAGGA